MPYTNKIRKTIKNLQKLSETQEMNFDGEIASLEKKITQLNKREPDKWKEAKNKHTPWERVKLTRSLERPKPNDYIFNITKNFIEFHGDRLTADDTAIVGGIGYLKDIPVTAIGTRRGKELKENMRVNFGMAHPEGYRKARRLMELAENFSFPLFTFIDTPGAYPGKKSEENNIGGAIARSIQKLLGLRVPTLATIIGEGGSGGAVAIGATDRVLMMENSIYSVISPEGCAAILWKDKDKAEEAANSLKLTASHVEEMGLIDEVIKEEDGGAHENFEPSAKNLANSLERHINELVEEDVDSLLEKRKKWYRSIGTYNKVE